MHGDRESARLKRILDYLSAHPRVAWVVRQNTGGAYLGDPPRYVEFGYEGAADITGMLRGGRRLEVECKVPGEWPTEETFVRWERGEGYQGREFKLTRRKKRLLAQRQNIERVNAGGGMAFIACDIADVVRELGDLEAALEELREHDQVYRQALVAAARARGGGRPRRGRWQELPPGVKGREQ